MSGLYYPPPKQNDVAKDAGKTLGILSLVFSAGSYFGFPTAVIGIILGYIAQSKSRKAGIARNTFAKVGIVLGWICVAIYTVVILYVLVKVNTDPTWASSGVCDNGCDRTDFSSGATGSRFG